MTNYTIVKEQTYLAFQERWSRAVCAAKCVDMAELEALRQFTFGKDNLTFLHVAMLSRTEHSGDDNSWLGDRVYIVDGQASP